MQSFIILIISGFLAGAIGGLLGIGGGIVLMPVLRFIVGLSPANAAGTCVIAVFFTTLGGSFRHYKLGHINLKSLVPVIIAGALSTVVFSVFFICLLEKQHWLDLGTGLVFCLVSVRMIVEGLAKPQKNKGDGCLDTHIQGPLLGKLGIGSSAGIFPGLLGIGTGAILVPAFIFILGAPTKIAIGSSLACFCINAGLSSAFKFFQGHVILNVAAPLCIGTLIGSNIGAVINKHFPSAFLKVIFGITFLYVSSKYIITFLGS